MQKLEQEVEEEEEGSEDGPKGHPSVWALQQLIGYNDSSTTTVQILSNYI